MTPRRRPAPTRVYRVGSRRSRLLVTLLAGVVGVVLSVGGTAFAYWSTVGDDDAARALADALPAGPLPDLPTTTPALNSTTVTFTLPQATTTGLTPLAAADYTIARYPAGGGSAVPNTASCTGTNVITCTESAVPEGQWQYTDTPTYGTNWVGAESVRSATVFVDSTAPVGVVGFPVAGVTYGANWGGLVSGSASDAGVGVASVGVAVQHTGSGLWWDGSGFGSATRVFGAASGTTTWGYPLPASVLTSGAGYAVTVQVVDLAGNTGISGATPFVFDVTPPVTAISYPLTDGHYGPNWTGSITGTSGDPAGQLSGVSVRIADITTGQWWNGTSWQSTTVTVPATVGSGGSWSYPLDVGELSNDHFYEIVAVGTDTAGNIGTSTPTSFQADVAALSVEVTYPVTSTVYGTNWGGILAGTTADLESNLSSVTLTIQDTTTNTYWTGAGWSASASTVPASGTSVWTYALAAANLTSLHDYTVTAQALDLSGNTGTSSPATWTFTTTTPTGAVSYPLSGTGYGANWAESITGTAAAATGLSVTGVDLTIQNTTTDTYWTGLTWSATPGTVPATGTTAWNYPLAFIALSSGDGYTVRATITDSAGNTTTSSPATWTYTTTAPDMAITTPITGTYGANWAGSITGTATAAVSGLTGVSVSILNATTGLWWDGTAFTSPSKTFTPATGTTSWSYPLAAGKLVNGNDYTVTAQGTDTAGNTGVSLISLFRYDTTPSTGAVTYPVTGTTYGANWAGAISGNAAHTAGLTVAAVTITVQNTTNNTYWNGTTWTATPTALPATGTTNWNRPLPATTLTTSHNYTTQATITDTAGNTTTTTPATFTYIAPATQLVITSAAVSGAAGSAATLGPVTVQARDSLGNPVVAPAGGITVTLSSNSTGVKVFSASSSGAVVTTVVIPAGASSVNFYYGDARAGTPTLTAAATGLTSATQTATVTAVAATRLAITSAAVSGTAASTATLGPVTVQARDSLGNPAIAPTGGITVNLSSTSLGTKVFAASASGTGVTSVVIPAGASSVNFYYGDTRAGTPTLTAAGTGLTSATQTATITTGAASRLAFLQQPTNVQLNRDFGFVITVVVVDQFGNATTNTASVHLATGPGSPGGILTGGGTKTAVSGTASYPNLSVSGGGNSAGVYTLVATGTGLTPVTSNPFTVS